VRRPLRGLPAQRPASQSHALGHAPEGLAVRLLSRVSWSSRQQNRPDASGRRGLSSVVEVYSVARAVSVILFVCASTLLRW